jgi:hypothetical protein
MFPLLTGWNEFVGTPMKEPLDSSIKQLLTSDTREANNYRDHIQEYTIHTV